MRSLEKILQSTSDALFPTDLGKRKVMIDSRDCDGDTPLHALLWRKDTGGANALIAACAEDINAAGDMGNTPLHVAVSQDLPDIVEVLLAAGANPDIRSEFGDTARERAVLRSDVVTKLIEWTVPNNSLKPDPLRGSA